MGGASAGRGLTLGMGVSYSMLTFLTKDLGCVVVTDASHPHASDCCVSPDMPVQQDSLISD